jgi:hypothetical protein
VRSRLLQVFLDTLKLVPRADRLYRIRVRESVSGKGQFMAAVGVVNDK